MNTSLKQKVKALLLEHSGVQEQHITKAYATKIEKDLMSI